MKEQQRIPRRKVKLPSKKLEAMFTQQARFQNLFYDFKRMNKPDKDHYLQLMLQCIHVETVEALNWLNWKPWKKQQQPWNRYEFLNELIDIQHFLINCALACQCDSEEFTKLFLNKGKENLDRQQRGY